MFANLVNSIFGKEDSATNDTEVAPADATPPRVTAKTRSDQGKKGSKKRYNERRKRPRAAAAFSSGKVLHATDNNFKAMVLKSEVPVVVDFWAPWCGPCKAMGPVLEELAAQLGPGARVVKLDVDDNPRTSARYNIRSIPTMMIFTGGEIQEVLVGLQSKDRLVNLLLAANG